MFNSKLFVYQLDFMAFPMDFMRLCMEFPWLSWHFPWISHGFPIAKRLRILRARIRRRIRQALGDFAFDAWGNKVMR